MTTDLVSRLRTAGATGLDLSPGDPLCAEAATMIEQLRLDLAQHTANTDSVLQAQGERDAAIEDVFRLLVAIRQYVAARQEGRGDLAAHWWTLQEIAKEPAADVGADGG